MMKDTAESRGLNMGIGNVRHRSSPYGEVAEELYGSNTLTDRKTIKEMWNILTRVRENCDDQPPSSNSPPNPGNKERRRRGYKRDYYSVNGHKSSREDHTNIFETESLLSVHEESVEAPSNRSRPIADPILLLKEEFRKQTMQWPTSKCEICSRLIYPTLSRRIEITPVTKDEFMKFGVDHLLGAQLIACSRCFANLDKGKVPAQAVCNCMNLGQLPDSISALNQHEKELIRRVRPYMKIVLLNNGRGQNAIKGSVVHFPQDIDDIGQQLPLDKVITDVIYVTEEVENEEFKRKIKVNPTNLLAALCFLRNNNPHYQDILLPLNGEVPASPTVLVKEGHADPDVNRIRDPTRFDALGFTCLRNAISILRGTISQSCSIFQSSAGKQCTGMCASFGVHSTIESPSTWTAEAIDVVLVDGNRYYNRIRHGENYLNIDDIEENFVCYGQTMHLRPAQATSIHRLYCGHLTNAKAQTPTLKDQITSFINSGEKFGILTVNDYSMAMFLEEDYVYWFDSHSRGARGALCENGTACVIKYPAFIAAKEISLLTHRNVQPKKSDAPLHQYFFTITPVAVTPVVEENNNEQSAEESGHDDETPFKSPISPTKKKPRCSKAHPDDEGTSDENGVQPDPATRERVFVREFGVATDADCVITDDDYIEPRMDNFNPNEYTLKRKQKHPISALFEKDLELLAFPHLFPHGRNGQNEERIIKQTPLDYFQARIMSDDVRFTSVEYLFYALDVCDRYRAFQKINVCTNMRNQETEDHIGEDQMVDPKLFMGGIRGTQQYWEKYKGNLIAMIKCLGIPTFFLTFSYDDMNSSDAVNAMWKAKMGRSAETIDPSTLTYEEKRDLLNTYGVAAARHFSMRLTKFLTFCQKNAVLIFGKPIKDYSVRVEFQLRGSPHTHMVIWLEDPPDFNTDEGIEFINRNISCSLDGPYRDMVLKYQKHRHTDTCHKNGQTKCRFNFPQVPSEETVMLGDEEIHRNGGRFVRLRRTEDEVMINNYHPILLPILEANMDIQPVTSAQGIAYYIAKYISKSEPREIQSRVRDAINEIKSNGNLTARQKMQRISLKIMNRRQVGAQEAAFRLCHLYLTKSSRVTVFVPTFRPENRFRMIRKETFGTENQEFCLNIIDRYIARPRSMEGICLFEFCSYYQPATKKQGIATAEFNDDDLDEHAEPEIIAPGNKFQLLNNKGVIVRRRRPCVIKIPAFNPIEDGENYYYSLILLYFPFRQESFLNGHGTCEAAFRALYPQFRTRQDDLCINPDLAVEMDQALLRMTELTEEEREQVDIEESFQYEFVEHEENNVTEQEIFPGVGLYQEMLQRINTLNADQMKVFQQFRDTVSGMTRNVDADKVLQLIVNGEGGSGKSYLIRLCSDFVKHTISKDCVLLCAPTGKASFQINGMTLHRTFALPVEISGMGRLLRLGSRKLEELRRVYRNVKFLIIDEMSMISYETLRNIHLRLCEIFENETEYGGLNTMLLGDLLQIKCVRGSYIFKKPAKFEAEVDLWRICEFVELTFNERQGQDDILGICRRLRVGELTMGDIELLQTRVLNPSDPLYHSRIAEFQDCLWAFPTIKQSDIRNQKRLEEMKEEGSILYTVAAKDTYADGSYQGRDCPKSLVPVKESNTGGLPASLILTMNGRVMLRRNIDVCSGKVNGALGTIVGFEWNNDNRQRRHGEMPRFISVRFDHDLRKVEKIFPVTVNFLGKKKNVTIARRQIPIINCFATNYHKLQGETVDRICIDLGKKIFGKGMAYVAISRVRTLAGLAISDMDIRKLVTSEKYNPCDLNALAELRRLRGEPQPAGEQKSQ